MQAMAASLAGTSRLIGPKLAPIRPDHPGYRENVTIAVSRIAMIPAMTVIRTECVLT